MNAGRIVVFLFVTLIAAAAAAADQPPTSCIQCHGSDADLFDDQARAKVKRFVNDVHARVGLSCHDCHGGNPDPQADLAAAMDAEFAPNPYIGAPKRAGIPDFCGRCHSSAAYMKRFNPAARVDQVAEYRTSTHGRQLARGDANVATCIECHSVHDIRRRSDPDSPVYPTHVAETCSRCHSDPARMAKYETRPGHRMPVDQYRRWQASVHARALLVKGDLGAPTCNDCHGNHGATPPGVESVSFVCGNCHGREAELFRKSLKHAGWTNHNELMAGGESCSSCHDDARARIETTRFSECITCHENHSVVRPSVAMLGNLPDTPCAFCHEAAGSLASLVAEPPDEAANYQKNRGKLLKIAGQMNLSGEARFDWLVDQALNLPNHRLPRPVRAGENPPLRPEFARLFEKFRIGKTHYTIAGGPGRGAMKVAVRRCSHCHQEGDAAGPATIEYFLAATRGLTSTIARAERILLAAHRGGVEVRQAQGELESAVDGQIELEALVHTFVPTGAFQQKEKEAMKHARAALIAARRSLDEVAYRRSGLLIALGVIVLVLVALAMKIRTPS